MREIHNPILQESYYEAVHQTGLTVLVYPKAGYSTTYAIVGTNYGSIDTFLNKEGERVAIPEGTAHFLEHKLFESEELDAFDRFSETGASANAYTSFDKTCYLFSCAGNFEENLRILLDFVRHPYFTEETVQKEQGIIGQEIRMYLDEPSWRVLFNLLDCLYENHPVKIDIAGTEASIAQINADLLYDCYHSFYNLNNMVLAVAGNVTPDQVLSIVDDVLGTQPEPPCFAKRADFGESNGIVKSYVAKEFPVTMPTFAMGYKEETGLELPTLKERILTGLLLDYVAGDTSPLFNRLLSEGLINGTFGYEYFVGPGYRTILFCGDSRDPEAVADAVKEELHRLKTQGLEQKDFDILRKMSYGRAVMDYNGIDGLANELIAAHFEGYHLFDELEIYQTVTVEDAMAQLEKQFKDENFALSVILPKEAD